MDTLILGTIAIISALFSTGVSSSDTAIIGSADGPTAIIVSGGVDCILLMIAGGLTAVVIIWIIAAKKNISIDK